MHCVVAYSNAGAVIDTWNSEIGDTTSMWGIFFDGTITLDDLGRDKGHAHLLEKIHTLWTPEQLEAMQKNYVEDGECDG